MIEQFIVKKNGVKAVCTYDTETGIKRIDYGDGNSPILNVQTKKEYLDQKRRFIDTCKLNKWSFRIEKRKTLPMQTFMPLPEFRSSLEKLDDKRLGKQRVEAFQIIRRLFYEYIYVCKNCRHGVLSHEKLKSKTCRKCGKRKLKISNAWKNHPAVLMWKGYLSALIHYYNTSLDVWAERGFKNKRLKRLKIKHVRLYPKWMFDEKFNAAHRSNLLRKNEKFYRKYGWKEPIDLPYVWPVQVEKTK